MKLKPLFLPLAGLHRAASRGKRQNMSPFGRLSSRAGRALEALAVTGCLLVAVGPAAADHPDEPHCGQKAGTNACLWVSPTDLGDDIHLVRVGIDVSMGEEEVEAVKRHKAAGGQVLFASIWGNDPREDDFRFNLPVPLPSEGPCPAGWCGEFQYTATGRELDEDDEGDGPDEIVGRIKVYFPRFNQFENYETGQVNHEFGR